MRPCKCVLVRASALNRYKNVAICNLKRMRETLCQTYKVFSAYGIDAFI